MSTVNVTSTTDTPEQVQAAVTGKTVEEIKAEAAKKKPEDYVPPAKKATETQAKQEDGGDDADADGDGDGEGATEGDDDAAGDDEEARKVKPRVKDQTQRRIGKLTWEKRELERKTRELEIENRALRLVSRGTPTETKTEEVKDEAPKFPEPRPKLDAYETIEEWQDAMSDWTERKVMFNVESKSTAGRARVEADQQNREQSETFARHVDRLNTFREEHADFDTVAQQALEKGLQTTPIMDQHFIHSDQGPELMFYLAQNPEECARIAKLKQGPALVALGKLEAKLERERELAETKAKLTDTEADNKPKKQRLDPPFRPGGSGTNAKSTKPVDQMTQKEYNAWRANGGGSRQ